MVNKQTQTRCTNAGDKVMSITPRRLLRTVLGNGFVVERRLGDRRKGSGHQIVIAPDGRRYPLPAHGVLIPRFLRRIEKELNIKILP